MFCLKMKRRVIEACDVIRRRQTKLHVEEQKNNEETEVLVCFFFVAEEKL